MTQPFIDTDVIIRLLTGDDPKKQAAASTLLERVEQGEVAISAPDTVIADAIHVLSSPRLYHLSREEIKDLLTPLVCLPHFQLQNRSAVLRALNLYASTKLDFGDTLILASMEQHRSNMLYSYDRDFDGFKGISRVEP